MESPYLGRATVTDYATHLEIIIPARRIWFFMIFFGIWLTGWCIGGLSVIVAVIFSDNTAALVAVPIWLVTTTVVMLTMGRMVWWMAFGKEVINIGQGVLSIDRKGDWLAKTKTYDLNEAINFRAQEDYVSYNSFMPSRNIMGLLNGGVIRFDYGMKTTKFAGGIDEAEGSYLLRLIQEKGLLPEKKY